MIFVYAPLFWLNRRSTDDQLASLRLTHLNNALNDALNAFCP